MKYRVERENIEETLQEIFRDPDTIIEIGKKLKKEQNENNKNTELIEELKSKAEYADLILSCKETMTVTTIAKEYGMSAKTFNQKLHELKIQYKQRGQWFLYKKYQNCGYTSSKIINYITPHGNLGVKFNMEWTQKGRMFLYKKLKENGIYPSIEL